MNKLKFSIIGCGRISYKHVEAIANNINDCELVAVADPVTEKTSVRANEYKEKTGCDVATYEDYKKMLDEVEIDAVVIATESGYHAEIAINCMNKGKHVIVEKPMALSTKDAEEMIRVSKENNVKLCVSHQNRFNPPIKKLRKALDEGKFGRLINATARILWTRNEGYYTQAPWRGTWAQDGGTLMNQCIHNIDLLQWMLGGEVDSIYAECDTFMRNIEGEDFGAIIIRFKNGAIGMIEGSACVYPKNLEETLSIFGETGTVCIGGLAVNKIETWKFEEEEMEEGSDTTEDPDSVYGHGHTPLFKDFIDSLREDREPLVNGKEGKKAMEIVLGAYKSRLLGEKVKFPLGDFSCLEMLELNNEKEVAVNKG